MHELLDDAGPRPLLVFVDDAHLLDDGSASLVHQLVQSGAATVIACVLLSGRARVPAADPMVVLWKDYGAARIELSPLDGQAMEDLLFAVLGGPVDTVSLRQVAERSVGDPLVLHELVAGALEDGSLARRTGSGDSRHTPADEPPRGVGHDPLGRSVRPRAPRPGTDGPRRAAGAAGLRATG